MTEQTRYHVRHWREKWDPDAELIFTKRLRLNFPKHEFVNPGDPVTPALRERLGIRKLLLWWHARCVGLKKWTIEPPVPAGPPPEPRDESTEPIEAIGGGWYRVTQADGTQHKVRGRKKAHALLEG